ncbi:lamin tail domain-containing protein [Sphingobacterium spiritivorum]|uniref:lamin tail domain-containing protein n=1 Tax=Sphingobacterium spiritivorum TaxID=258 RepID=UPI003DA47F85
MSVLIEKRQLLCYWLAGLLHLLTPQVSLHAQNTLLPSDTLGVLFMDKFQAGQLHQWQPTRDYFVEDNILRISPQSSSPAYLHSSILPKAGMQYEIGFTSTTALSSANYFRFYLSVNKPSTHQPHEGYHLQVDGTSDYHFYKLYRQNGNSRMIIFQSTPLVNEKEHLSAQVMITCDQNGIWRIAVKEYEQKSFLTLLNTAGQAQVKDNVYKLQTDFGLASYFTATRRSSLRFHYILLKAYSSTDQLSVKRASILNPKTISILFSDPLDTATMSEQSNYFISPPKKIENITSQDSIVYLHLKDSLVKETFQINIRKAVLFTGDQIALDTTITLSHTLPYKPHPQDIIINEILFNPKPGGVDFVEIYNNSIEDINLQNWKIGKYNIADTVHYFPAGHYRLLTTNGTIVKQHYPATDLNNLIQLRTLPAYTNISGVVTLRYQEQIIDSLFYTENMHSPFITNKRGISLERQQYKEDTNTPGNFRSSATSAEGATPGYQNSRYSDKIFKKNNFFLTSRTFSPDGDSFEDLLFINYEIQVENAMISLSIVNDRGHMINRLIRNKSIGSSGQITWDGRTENGSPAPPGIYLYIVELYDNQGFNRTFRGSFVLASATSHY